MQNRYQQQPSHSQLNSNQSRRRDVNEFNSTPILQQGPNMANIVKTSSNISHNSNTSSSNLYDQSNNNNNNNNNNKGQYSSKHLYHNLYSSPTKQEMRAFIPPLNKNSNTPVSPSKSISSPTIKPLADNSNFQNTSSNNNNTKTNINHNHNYSHNHNHNHSHTLHNHNHTHSHSNKNTNNSDIFSSPVKTKLKKPKICKVCSKPIIGTLVRAMGNIYHVDCFTCYDCKKPCSDKFFAADINVDLNGKSLDNKIINKDLLTAQNEVENINYNNNDIQNTKIINVPLCEYDYFRRIDLICYTCNNAIRGSYITALGRKYHAEHFFCEICHKVFESDNYYANDGKIYCHFHYSKLYAYHCESCKCAILKQYVEIFRGGKQQQWHPECFMVHKFWNVDITIYSLGLGIDLIDDVSSNPEKLYKVETSLEKLTISIWLTLSDFEESCASLISEMLHSATTNNKTKGLIATSKLIFKIRCLYKSIESLFKYANLKHIKLNYSLPKYQNFSQLIKEPRSLTSKMMSYLTFLRDIDSEKLTVNKYSQELLSLISTIAHFIKLISRNALLHALEFNGLSKSMKPTEILLNEISIHENYPSDLTSLKSISSKSNDSCTYCNKSIEDDCILFKIDDLSEKRWHINCFHCSKCLNKKEISISDLSESAYNIENGVVLCPSCASADVNAQNGFHLVSRFMQLAYLLEIAIIRSKIVINKRERKNHSKQLSDTSISTSVKTRIVSKNSSVNYDLNKSHSVDKTDSRIPSNSTTKSSDKDSYEKKVTEITRRRSLREARKLSSANREIRKSVIIEVPIAASASTEEIIDNKKVSNTKNSIKENSSANDLFNSLDHQNTIDNPLREHNGFAGSKKLLIHDLKMGNDNVNIDSFTNDKQFGQFNAALTSKLLQNENSLTLDDIPRIVSSEQAREHRPNAFRFQRRDYTSAISNLPIPKAVKTKDVVGDSKSVTQPPQVGVKNPSIFENITLPSSSSQHKKNNVNLANGKRYSDFNQNSHEYIRHIAAYALYDMFSNKMTLEECSGLIDIKKSHSFWEKLFGSSHNNSESDSKSSNNNNNSDFKSGSATIAGSGKGVFGVSLTTLISKYGADSDLGVGTHKVRIPLLIDELITVMRTQDVSVEGVFRLNGNIRRLRQLVEAIESHPQHIPKLENETPIQLAAVLKKFLRDLPIPLLTFKLYDLFLLSQKLGTGANVIEDDYKLARKRERILKLAYAMLPKANRDLTEVLLAFLSWVSTFANINDEENIGSKMDTHNLATVITPNILYAKVDSTGKGDKDGTDALGLVNSVGGENQFLAIEVVNEMIEMNDELSIVPDDILRLYKLGGFDKDEDSKEKDKSLVYTKDIMAKLKSIVESNPGVLQKL
ncbi:hypothetical protein C6P42_003561 [Pichia californica]|nr:hypothetical protein C6P42_003561 [[Candida] californica]